MATTDLHFVTGGLKPVHRGVRFLGGAVDDQIQINASGAAMANSSTHGTISAWFMVPDKTGTYGIVSYGDASVVEFIQINVEAGTILVQCTDNTTAQWDYNTASGTVKPHVWHHVALVQDGEQPKVYLDGNLMALTTTTGTTPASWFKACAGIDSGSIGCNENGGDGGLTQEFKGYISDVRVWAGTTTAAALSETDVNRVMSGEVLGTEFNLWKLDNDVVDDGTGADNGTIVGDLIYSAANPFASRLTFLETVPVTADNISIMCSEGVGYAYAVLSA